MEITDPYIRKCFELADLDPSQISDSHRLILEKCFNLCIRACDMGDVSIVHFQKDLIDIGASIKGSVWARP